ncbi:unnamed protein product, partial [Didymodactylos carnosus]
RFGAIILNYSKVHTCDFTDIEGLTYPGDGWSVAVLNTKKGSLKVGAMICYDREQPESARILMVKGAELILIPNACYFDQLRLSQLQVRSFENALITAMANYPQPLYNGWSAAFNFDGQPLNLIPAQNLTQAEVILVEFDLIALREYRAKTIMGDAFRRPYRYEQLLKIEREQDFKATNFYRRDRLF